MESESNFWWVRYCPYIYIYGCVIQYIHLYITTKRCCPSPIHRCGSSELGTPMLTRLHSTVVSLGLRWTAVCFWNLLLRQLLNQLNWSMLARWECQIVFLNCQRLGLVPFVSDGCHPCFWLDWQSQCVRFRCWASLHTFSDMMTR